MRIISALRIDIDPIKDHRLSHGRVFIFNFISVLPDPVFTVLRAFSPCRLDDSGSRRGLYATLTIPSASHPHATLMPHG